MILGVDIETCSAADIEDGAAPYAEHPSTRVWCVCFTLAVARGTPPALKFRWTGEGGLPSQIVSHIMRGGPVLAHNAAFEQCIWSSILVPGFGFPEVKLHQWRDSLLFAAAAGLPLSLGALGPVLGTPVEKDKEGRDLMLSLAKAKPRKGGGYDYPEPTPEQFARLVDYCATDVDTMLECWWRLPRPTEFELAVMHVDREINTRGVLVSLNLAADMAATATLRAQEINDDVWFVTEDLLDVGSSKALVGWLTDRGVKVPKVVRKRSDGTFRATESVDRASIAAILATPVSPEVRRVLELRVEAGRLTSLAKTRNAPNMVCRDGRLRHAFRYHKAHTGRWSSEGFQLHNTVRPSKEFKVVSADFTDAVRAHDLKLAKQYYPQVLEGLSFLSRALLVASPGCELVGGDYASIEARVMAWVCGFTQKLDIFRAYDAAAGLPEAERKKLDPYVIAAANINSDNRQLGKVCELALQYGMGVLTFRDTAAKQNVALDLKAARKIQRAWRATNKPIAEFWRELQNACIMAVGDPGSMFDVGKVTVVADHQCLRIFLPSGRCLHYWRPAVRTVTKKIETVDDDGCIQVREVTMQELSFFTPGKRGMERESTYGGKLTENLVQAIARDILAHALVELTKANFAVVLHVHDSITAEIERPTEADVRIFLKLMQSRPAWAEGLPIAVDGYRGRHFKG